MACCHPFKRFLTGGFTENGKPDGVLMSGTCGNFLSVAYAEKRGKTVFPSAPLVRINGHTYITDPQAVPCGNCVGCRMDKAKQWKIRIVHEMEKWPVDQVHFVTLTYREECLPRLDDGRPYLRKEDVRKFLIDLRHPSYGVYKSWRFFACGEYGTAEYGTHRPHFHIILFGALSDLIPFAPKRAHSKIIEAAWPYGLSEVSPVEPNVVAYVAGYVEKKQNDPNFDKYPVKPFLVMSRNLGIHYVSKLTGSKDRKVYGNFGSVCFAGIPRAYLKKCEKRDWFEQFKKQSAEIASKSLRCNLAAVGTSSEEVLGDVQESASKKKLEKLRKVSL